MGEFEVHHNTSATNSTVNFLIGEHNGTNVTYHYTWEKGTGENNGSLVTNDGDLVANLSAMNDRTMTHVFKNFGNKTFEVNASNEVKKVSFIYSR